MAPEDGDDDINLVGDEHDNFELVGNLDVGVGDSVADEFSKILLFDDVSTNLILFGLEFNDMAGPRVDDGVEASDGEAIIKSLT